MAERSTWPASAWEIAETDIVEGREVKTAKRFGQKVRVTFTEGEPVDYPADDEVAVHRLVANTPLARALND